LLGVCGRARLKNRQASTDEDNILCSRSKGYRHDGGSHAGYDTKRLERESGLWPHDRFERTPTVLTHKTDSSNYNAKTLRDLRTRRDTSPGGELAETSGTRKAALYTSISRRMARVRGAGPRGVSGGAQRDPAVSIWAGIWRNDRRILRRASRGSFDAPPHCVEDPGIPGCSSEPVGVSCLLMKDRNHIIRLAIRCGEIGSCPYAALGKKLDLDMPFTPAASHARRPTAIGRYTQGRDEMYGQRARLTTPHGSRRAKLG